MSGDKTDIESEFSLRSERAERLLALLPDGVRNCWCESGCKTLRDLAHSLTARLGGELTSDPTRAGLILLDRSPQRPEDLTSSTTLIFGGGKCPSAWQATLDSRTHPAWFIEEVCELKSDLFAVLGGTSGRTVRLAPFEIIDHHGRQLPPGLFGELALRHGLHWRGTGAMRAHQKAQGAAGGRDDR